ncbi:hypothetical protein NP233_g1809 [Leucocoprinus birnbaumii]|uniref:Uncharacterized protein n=1 Tax=Leucocoprinus birnbaumii TaxID=56174 RepID=A0AAD5YZF4_9AGAR|nr:hypothetical protein NP233_g1809 [Leucocoprinus birnbaumii]
MDALSNPDNPTWVKFDLAACRSSGESIHGKILRVRIASCTFDEFCAAYKSASLFTLLQYACGISLVEPYTIALLTETPEVNSVWWLSQLIECVVSGGHESDPSFEPLNPIIRIDYSVMNCKTLEGFRLLVDLYEGFWKNEDSNPLALHEAAMRGR